MSADANAPDPAPPEESPRSQHVDPAGAPRPDGPLPVLEYRAGLPGTMVTLAIFGDELEAQLAAGLLEAEGIAPVLNQDDQIGRIYSGSGHAAKLSVDQQNVAAALEILLASPARSKLLVKPAEPHDEMVRCPACSSAEVRCRGVSPWRAAAATLLGPLLGPARAGWRCKQCGRVWRQ